MTTSTKTLWPCPSVWLPFTKKKIIMRLKMRINRGGHWALSIVMWRALVWCQTLCASNRSLTKWTIRQIKSYSLFQLSTGHPKMHTILLSILLSWSFWLQNGFTYSWCGLVNWMLLCGWTTCSCVVKQMLLCGGCPCLVPADFTLKWRWETAFENKLLSWTTLERLQAICCYQIYERCCCPCCWQVGCQHICSMTEVGRGCWKKTPRILLDWHQQPGIYIWNGWPPTFWNYWNPCRVKRDCLDIYGGGHIPHTKISLTNVEQEEEKDFPFCLIAGSWPLHLHSLLHLQGTYCPWHFEESAGHCVPTATLPPNYRQLGERSDILKGMPWLPSPLQEVLSFLHGLLVMSEVYLNSARDWAWWEQCVE